MVPMRAVPIHCALVFEHLYDYHRRMDDPELIPITEEDGLTYWITQPPPACPNGHPFRPGDITTYGEGWFACNCDAAQSSGERAGHSRYTCQRCGAATDVPACTDPGAVVGWAASHAH
jgi:hypothetical protein